jgi:hypothetical protein
MSSKFPQLVLKSKVKIIAANSILFFIFLKFNFLLTHLAFQNMPSFYSGYFKTKNFTLKAEVQM